MPVYEYRCADCGAVFTVVMSVGEYETSQVPACNACKSRNVKRLYTAVSVVTSKKS
jgi:putative FmdB family regulatory protein